MNEPSTPDQIIFDDIKRILPGIKCDSLAAPARFFVTGGTGFVGVWLLHALLALCDERRIEPDITVLSRSPERFAATEPHLASRIKMIRGDISDFDYPNENFDYIIHAAAEADARRNDDDPIGCFESVVGGTKRVLDFAAARNCNKLLFVSSGAVYGRQPSDLPNVEEDFSGAPNVSSADGAAAYAEGKRAAEMLCHMYAKKYGVEVKIARLFAFIGPHLPLDEHFAAGNFIRDALAGGPIHVNGDGTPHRSYMYAADMAGWLLSILFVGKNCRPYNVGSGDAISIADLARAVARVVAPDVDVIIAERPAPGALPSRYVPSISRAANELGVASHFDLAECIMRTIDWNTRGSLR